MMLTVVFFIFLLFIGVPLVMGAAFLFSKRADTKSVL